LIAYLEAESIRGFAFCDVRGEKIGRGAVEPTRFAAEECAICIGASMDGERLSYSVQDEDLFRIVILVWNGERQSFEEELTIWDANYPEHFWSKTGRYLLFSSQDGGIETIDFSCEERRWVLQNSFEPAMPAPYRISFSPDDGLILMEVTDEHGYRQLTRFDMEQGTETRFTAGWVDHYGPEISSDIRFIAYRQRDLPKAGQEEDGSGEEMLYAYDLEKEKSYHLGNRRLDRISIFTGPKLSTAPYFAYFERSGCIYQFPLDP